VGGKEVVVLIRVVLTLLIFLGFSAAAEAGTRLALVIGNSQYSNVPALPNPVRDGEAIASLLRSIGFDAETRLNLDRVKFESALSNFAAKAEDADIAIVYFAGHGIEVDGTNYLIPVDARLATDKQARFELISLDDVLASLDGVKGLRAVFLDACRNNPFVATMTRSKSTRSIAQGFMPVEARNGTIISYAAKEGTVAADGLGNHSPYASALLTYMGEPGLEIQFMLRKVRDKVQNLTDGRQEPYISASISGDPIYLAEPPPKADAAAPALDPIQADFQSAKMIDTAGAWQAFLDRHGQDASNFYVRLAIEARQKVMQAAAAQESGFQGTIREIEAAKPDAAAKGPEADNASQRSDGSGEAGKTAADGSAKKKPDKPKASRAPKTESHGDRSATAKQKKQVKSAAKPKAAAAKAARQKDRPNATRYSYRVWGEGTLQTGRSASRSTEFGTLTCKAMNAFGTQDEIHRFCSWR